MGIQAGLQVLVTSILAHLLAPADFGLVSAALVVVGFSAIFSQLGVGPAVVQRPDLETRHVRTGFTVSMLFSIALAGLLFLFAPGFASFFRLQDLTPIIRAMSLVFLCQGLSVVAESLLQRDLRFRWLAGVNVVAYAIGYGTVGIVLAFLRFGVWALVGAHLAQTIFRTIILLVAHPHPMRPLLERQAFKELMYFGGGFTAARVCNYIAGQGDNWVVSRWLGAASLGLYGRAYQLMAMPATLFGQVLDKVLFPSMSRVQSQPKRLSVAYGRGVALIALLVLPMSVMLFVLAPEFIYVLLGPKWVEVVVPFRIFAVGMLFRTSYKMSDSIARATGAVYRRAWRQGIYAFLVVGGAWIGQHWGLAGVAFGVLGAIAINFVLMAQLSLNLAAMTWRSYWAVHIPALALTAVLGVEVWALAMALRNWGFSPILVLMTSAAVMLATLLLLLRYMPGRFLGQDGMWMLQTLTAYIPKKINLFRCLNLGDR
jgi:O-antigen/teichoic acid export membrane protein